MAGLLNATDRLLGALLDLGAEEGSWRASSPVRELVAELRASGESAASRAAGLIPAGSVIATCSYSTAAVRTLKAVGDGGKTPRVLVFESAAGTDGHGRRLADELAGLGLSARLVDGPITRSALGNAGLALVGADAVTAEFVLNGTPSLDLAQAVRGQVPLYVVCETVKFTRDARAEPDYD